MRLRAALRRWAALRAALSAILRLRHASQPDHMPEPESAPELQVELDLTNLSGDGVDELAARLMSAAVSAADEAVGVLLHQAARDVTDVAIDRAEKRLVRLAEQAAAEAAGEPPCPG
jgi:hypothetical protein